MILPPALVLAAGALLVWITTSGQPTTTVRAQDKPGDKSPNVPPHFDELAKLPFTENRPTKETAQTLRDELLFQRATQTYLWALPLVNMLGMKVCSFGKFDPGAVSG
jgi:hypothetical protein